MDKLVGAVWSLALVLLDRYLDSKIDTLKDSDDRATLKRAKDFAVDFLTGPVGKEIAVALGKQVAIRAVVRWFPNEKSTGTWG